jgi:hypothetical protein
MPIPATRHDPLANFLRHLGEERALVPIPLIAIRIDVAIRGGLAVVTTERTFRNSETHSIEASMTFPLPVDATLCALTARIGNRNLKAVAEIRKRARQDYEEALSLGKTAVLHEEPLKGIHMISVGHVAPGTEIAVFDTWTAPLSFIGATPRLRIPTTVGEIYGCSPLSPSDDIIVGDVIHKASIGIVCASGTASLESAGEAQEGRFVVRLNRPIDIVIDGWKPEALEGRAADGRKVTLDIKPAAKSHDSLDVGILFDHSGSMNEQASGEPHLKRSKFEVAKAALLELSKEQLTPSDRMQLWEFNDQVEFIGSASGAEARALVERLHSPVGGTEIGEAFEAVIASAKTNNLIVVTDGKSWAFDPQALARCGIRVNAVLIGEDALEAGIAHLAAMTGGQVFVAAGSDAGIAIAAALDAARTPHKPLAPIKGNPARVEALRRGAIVLATWGAMAKGKSSVAARQVGATAAALAVPLLAERTAALLAKREGIVTHLTSLVLIDEAGERCGELPARRKVPLEARRIGAMQSYAAPRSMALFACAGPPSSSPIRAMARQAFFAADGLDSIFIDWDADPEALRRGNLDQLDTDSADAIRSAAKNPAVVKLADALGTDPLIIVVALLAHAALWSRSAQRLARAIFGTTPEVAIAIARDELGL